MSDIKFALVVKYIRQSIRVRETAQYGAAECAHTAQVVRIKRLLHFLFACYLLTTAIIFLIVVPIYSHGTTPSIDMLLLLSDVATFYMAFSVFDYRKRLISGAVRFRSLTAFQIFYGILTIVVMLSGNSLATDIIDRLIGLLFLSFFYAPVDIAVRVRSFFKHKHSPAIRP